MSQTKRILVLARRDQLEAMRVSAGMTIFGHQVSLIFMDRPVTEEAADSEQAELLELAGIEPVTTVREMEGMLPVIDATGLADAIRQADGVVNL